MINFSYSHLLRFFLFSTLILSLFFVNCTAPLPMRVGECSEELTYLSRYPERQMGCLLFPNKQQSDMIYLIKFSKGQFFYCDKNGTCNIETVSYPVHSTNEEVALLLFPPYDKEQPLVGKRLFNHCLAVIDRTKPACCWNYKDLEPETFPFKKCWLFFRIVFTRHFDAKCYRWFSKASGKTEC